MSIIAAYVSLMMATCLLLSISSSTDNVGSTACPQPEKGEMGPPGHSGKPGVRGYKGEPGSEGRAGPKGSKGENGPPGIIGSRGKQGPSGVTGPPGKQGITGAQGPPGKTGIQGENGIRGPPGIKGEKGIKGDVGSTGPRGIEGADGTPGPPGHAGAIGLPGQRGHKGERGLPGYKGEQGPQGVPGPEMSESTLQTYFAPVASLHQKVAKLNTTLQTLLQNYSERSEPVAAHLYGSSASATISSGTLITYWSTSTSQPGFLSGGMKYDGGFITVPHAGIYYVYSQFWFDLRSGQNYCGFIVKLNDKYLARSRIYQANPSTYDESQYTGFLVVMEKGDRLSVVAAYTCYLEFYQYSQTAFFGAFQVV
ncbi:collagen alpha-1(XI) chain-like [Corticium candelabrum]|uniref:collagen alpha-1(XI) chain-like n=1 Tax=Corticium candelabrum TaxID=121492 RepID=UPI002E252BDA|nr:collagen alpha-1(XI) chain-like [Corticium candelabrum]